jgi:hypothetical protein
MRTLLAVLCFVALPIAHADIDFNGISYAGTGCTGDGNGIRVTESTSEPGRLIIYTPDMDVTLDNGKTFARAACNIVIPVTVAADQRLVIGNPSVFGSENLSSGETLDAKATVFMLGSTGPEVHAEITGNGPRLGQFYKRELTEETLPCGQGGLIRAATSVLAQKQTEYAAGAANVRGLAFDVRIEACN